MLFCSALKASWKGRHTGLIGFESRQKIRRELSFSRPKTLFYLVVSTFSFVLGLQQQNRLLLEQRYTVLPGVVPQARALPTFFLNAYSVRSAWSVWSNYVSLLFYLVSKRCQLLIFASPRLATLANALTMYTWSGSFFTFRYNPIRYVGKSAVPPSPNSPKALTSLVDSVVLLLEWAGAHQEYLEFTKVNLPILGFGSSSKLSSLLWVTGGRFTTDVSFQYANLLICFYILQNKHL